MSKKVGRPSLGITKKVSITLPEEYWDLVEELQTLDNMTKSETLRKILKDYLNVYKL